MSILFVCAAPAESWLSFRTKEARMEFLCPSCPPYRCISSQDRVRFMNGNKRFFLCAKGHFHIVVVGAVVCLLFLLLFFKFIISSGISNNFLHSVTQAAVDLEEWWTVRDGRTDGANRAASWRTHCRSRLWLAGTRLEQDVYWPSGCLGGVELKIDEAAWQSLTFFF